MTGARPGGYARPMTRLTAVLVAALFGSAGCVAQSTATTGDLTVHYTFGGKTCGAASVSEIDVTVTGQSVNDGGSLKVDCATGGSGATLPGLSVGRYTVALSGVDTSGTVLYAVDGQKAIVHGGANTYAFDLPPVTGKLTLDWTFAGSTTCGAVDTVHVTALDPQSNVYDDQKYPCSGGGVVYDAVVAGAWTVSMEGLDAGGQVLYQASDQPVQVVAGQDNQATIDLQ